MKPSIHSVVETAAYVEDLPRAVKSYTDVLGLEMTGGDDRFAVFAVAPGQVFLLFQRGVTGEGMQTPGGFIPGHDGSGPQHFAFGISAGEVRAWSSRLSAAGVVVESKVDWPLGGSSLFFRDPDGHLVELVTPGTWMNY